MHKNNMPMCIHDQIQHSIHCLPMGGWTPLLNENLHVRAPFSLSTQDNHKACSKHKSEDKVLVKPGGQLLWLLSMLLWLALVDHISQM